MVGLSILLIVGASLAWLWIEQERARVHREMDEIDSTDHLPRRKRRERG